MLEKNLSKLGFSPSEIKIYLHLLKFGTSYAPTTYYSYFDALSLSWDPNYNIGDNLNEGLLLSF